MRNITKLSIDSWGKLEMTIRDEIHCTINSLSPFDEIEQEHISFTKNWIESGVEIFRTAKPATPDPHLVAYFLLIDSSANQVLLVDHIFMSLRSVNVIKIFLYVTAVKDVT